MSIKTHVLSTYQQLRLMAGLTLFIGPLAILAMGSASEIRTLPTLSHYYFSEWDVGPIRTTFTGFLILAGGIMLAYRGHTRLDNWIHNLAGLFAFGVAFFPKGCDTSDLYCTPVSSGCIHGASAGALFLMALSAVIYRGGETFRSKLSNHEKMVLNGAMWLATITMAIGVGVYLAFLALKGLPWIPDYGILIAELGGFFGFGAYWLIVTAIIAKANRRIISERKIALEHKPSRYDVSPIENKRHLFKEDDTPPIA